ncbi:MAG TPA: hypothetical protein VNL14_03605 [Candidatus Acidoferrales bacterium]|nr:hypothetical protein [Candidatus Acidoferrales bacterium]
MKAAITNGTIGALGGCLLVALVTSGCATLTGAALGGGIGAGVGAATHHSVERSAAIGAGVGGGLGALYDIYHWGRRDRYYDYYDRD